MWNERGSLTLNGCQPSLVIEAQYALVRIRPDVLAFVGTRNLIRLTPAQPSNLPAGHADARLVLAVGVLHYWNPTGNAAALNRRLHGRRRRCRRAGWLRSGCGLGGGGRGCL